MKIHQYHPPALLYCQQLVVAGFQAPGGNHTGKTYCLWRGSIQHPQHKCSMGLSPLCLPHRKGCQPSCGMPTQKDIYPHAYMTWHNGTWLSLILSLIKHFPFASDRYCWDYRTCTSVESRYLESCYGPSSILPKFTMQVLTCCFVLHRQHLLCPVCSGTSFPSSLHPNQIRLEHIQNNSETKRTLLAEG